MNQYEVVGETEYRLSSSTYGSLAPTPTIS